jgi:hypothetical protein
MEMTSGGVSKKQETTLALKTITAAIKNQDGYSFVEISKPINNAFEITIDNPTNSDPQKEPLIRALTLMGMFTGEPIKDNRTNRVTVKIDENRFYEVISVYPNFPQTLTDKIAEIKRADSKNQENLGEYVKTWHGAIQKEFESVTNIASTTSTTIAPVETIDSMMSFVQQNCTTANEVKERLIEYLSKLENDINLSNDAKQKFANLKIRIINDERYSTKLSTIPKPGANQPASIKTFNQLIDPTSTNGLSLTPIDNFSASSVIDSALTTVDGTEHNYLSITATMFAQRSKITNSKVIVAPMFSNSIFDTPGQDEKAIQAARDEKALKKYIEAQKAAVLANQNPTPRRLLIPLGLPGHECGLVVDLSKGTDGKLKSEVLFFDPLGGTSYRSSAQPFIDAVTTDKNNVFESKTKYQDLNKGDYNCGTWTLWFLLEQASKGTSLSDLANQNQLPSGTDNKAFVQNKRQEFRDSLTQKRHELLREGKTLTTPTTAPVTTEPLLLFSQSQPPRTPIATDLNQTLANVKRNFEQNKEKYHVSTIREPSQGKLEIDMYVKGNKSNPPKTLYAEQLPQGGVKYSIAEFVNQEDKRKFIEQCVAGIVNSSPTGTIFDIPKTKDEGLVKDALNKMGLKPNNEGKYVIGTDPNVSKKPRNI